MIDVLMVVGWSAVCVWIAYVAYRDGRSSAYDDAWADAHARIGLAQGDLAARHRQLLDDYGHAIAVLDALNEDLDADDLRELVDESRALLYDANLELLRHQAHGG